MKYVKVSSERIEEILLVGKKFKSKDGNSYKIETGKRGGIYYTNPKGKKVYLKKKGSGGVKKKKESGGIDKKKKRMSPKLYKSIVKEAFKLQDKRQKMEKELDEKGINSWEDKKYNKLADKAASKMDEADKAKSKLVKPVKKNYFKALDKARATDDELNKEAEAIEEKGGDRWDNDKWLDKYSENQSENWSKADELKDKLKEYRVGVRDSDFTRD